LEEGVAELKSVESKDDDAISELSEFEEQSVT
jgi:hypothetical protein